MIMMMTNVVDNLASKTKFKLQSDDPSFGIMILTSFACTFAHLPAHLLVCSLICSYACLFAHMPAHLLIGQLICSLPHLLAYLAAHSLVSKLACSFFRLFAHLPATLVYLLPAYLPTCLVICLLVHSFARCTMVWEGPILRKKYFLM